MATKPNYAVPDNPDEPQREIETSITARIVRSISVNMSTAEMEILIGSFGKSHYDVNDAEATIQREFTLAVHSLR